MDTKINTIEIGDYRITIHSDWSAQCPVTNWTLAARYLFEYNDHYGHSLHDECDWRDVWGEHGSCQHSLDESLAELIKENCDFDKLWNYIKSGKLESVRLEYDRSCKLWRLKVYGHRIFDGRPSWCDISEIDTDDRKDKNWYVFEELFVTLNRSGLVELLNMCCDTIYVTEWDSMGYSQGDYVSGVAYCTKEFYDERVGGNEKPWKQHIQELIDGEVKCIGMWMWGDVIGFTLDKKVRFVKHYEDPERADEDAFEWEEVDSCWGYFMKPDELIDEVIAEHDIKEEIAA